MAVKIRLQRHGRKQRPFYHIVVADARAPRDGRFIEKLGIYNPLTKPATIELDIDQAYHWLTLGAQPTNTARAILKYKGVMYKKHLQRGVKKGALTQEEADNLLADWIKNKEAKHNAKKEETEREKAEYLKMISGEIKPKLAKADSQEADEFVSTEASAESEVEAEATAPEAEASAESEAEAEATAPEVEASAESEAEAEATAPEAEASAEPEAEAEATAPEAEASTEPEVEAEATAPEAEASTEPEVEAEATAPEVEASAESEAEAEATAGTNEKDDLKKIEGIGPKIEELLNNANIYSFADLASKSVDALSKILEEGGPRMKMHSPETWPEQSKLAAQGKWDELKVLQDELDGGRKV